MSIVAIDNFGPTRGASTEPANNVVGITPSDSDELSNVSRAILASADTVVALVTATGQVITGFPLQKGYNPIRVKQIKATGTTLAGATLWNLW